MPGLGPELTTLKECATVVVLKLFFSTTLPFYQFLAHCLENREVECFSKFCDQK